MLVYEHKVPYRLAHRCFGELVRMAEEGADHATLVAHLKSRLPTYPRRRRRAGAHHDGESKAHIMLNTKAFRAVHDELDSSLRKMAATPHANPVDTALDRLMDEARRAIGG